MAWQPRNSNVFVGPLPSRSRLARSPSNRPAQSRSLHSSVAIQRGSSGLAPPKRPQCVPQVEGAGDGGGAGSASKMIACLTGSGGCDDGGLPAEDRPKGNKQGKGNPKIDSLPTARPEKTRTEK